MRVLILKVGDQEVEMPAGESFIGRALDCQVRFNDASVSRRHLRVICRKDEVHIENLSITNEALLNSMPLLEACQLRDGDQIQIAHQVLEVILFDREKGKDATPIRTASPGPLAFQVNHVEGAWDSDTLQNPQLSTTEFEFDFSSLNERNCPKCRTRVLVSEPECNSCGYLWPATGPARRTQKILVSKESLRENPRQIVRVPVIYSSDDLTLDVVARDLGRGGMFLASEILEPVGTTCHITALPDGRPALHFSAVVCHVSTKSVSGRPPGFGVKFNELSAEANEWLCFETPSLAKDTDSPE